MNDDNQLIMSKGQDLLYAMTEAEAKEYIFTDDRCDPKKEIQFYNFLIEKNEDDPQFIDYDSGVIMSLAGTLEDFYCWRAEEKRKLGMIEEALADCNEVLLIQPKCSNAYNMRGCIYQEKREVSLALAAYRKAISIDNNPYALYNCGMYYEYKGITDKTKRYYDLAILEYSKQSICYSEELAEVYFSRGKFYDEMGYSTKAYEDYSAAIEQQSQDYRAYWFRGEIYHDRNEYDKALEDYNQAILLQPEEEHLYRLRGHLHEKMKWNDKALEDYAKAIELAPAEWRSYAMSGMLFEKIGRYEQAEAVLSRAIDRDITGIENIYHIRGDVYSLMGIEYEIAEAMDYSKAVSVIMKNVEKYCNEQNYNEAISAITHAIEIKPEESSMLRYRGDMYLAIGDYDKAIEDYENAIAMMSGNSYILASLYHGCGNAFSLKEMYQEAIDCYTIAIEMVEEIKARSFNEKIYCKLYIDRAAAYDKLDLHGAAAQDRSIVENLCKNE